MFDSSPPATSPGHLGDIWITGRNRMKFRFEVSVLHVPAPGAVEIQACLRAGRYALLRIGPSGRTVPHPKAEFTLTHRPGPADTLSVDEVVCALKCGC